MVIDQFLYAERWLRNEFKVAKVIHVARLRLIHN